MEEEKDIDFSSSSEIEKPQKELVEVPKDLEEELEEELNDVKGYV